MPNVPSEELAAYKERREGRARSGTVTLRSFDEGVVETLGAEILDTPEGPNYFIVPSKHKFLKDNMSPPPGSPGIPVTFASPEDVFEKWKIPVLVVRREDFTPAMERWQSMGSRQYRAPAEDATPIQVGNRRGFDKMEESQQAFPFDFNYSLIIQARHRGAPGIRNQANVLLHHVLRVYPTYCAVRVRDSNGDYRGYDAFSEGASSQDDLFDVADRTISFSVSLRVEGELDLHDPMVYRTVRALVPNFGPRS